MPQNLEVSPSIGTKINFAAASAYARKIHVYPKIIKLTGKHRGSRASLDNGWLIIEQRWYPQK